MEFRNATLEELLAEGAIDAKTATEIEQYARHIKETGDLPPAKSTKVTFLGRPKKLGENLVPMNTRITETQRDFLDRYAEETGETRADIIREAIDLLRSEKQLATA